MNRVDMQTLIKIVLGCVILFLFSPFIFGIFGMIAKIILWIVIALVLLVTFSIMYLKHKAKKSGEGFYSVNFGDKDKDVKENTSTDTYVEDNDDFSTADVVDVEYEEAEDEEN